MLTVVPLRGSGLAKARPATATAERTPAVSLLQKGGVLLRRCGGWQYVRRGVAEPAARPVETGWPVPTQRAARKVVALLRCY